MDSCEIYAKPMADRSKTFLDIATRVGKLVGEKNRQYGDSANTSAQMLRLLWPDGVPVESYGAMLLIVRCWDKFNRIATANGQADPGGENPWQDVLGYCLLALEQAERQCKEYPLCR